MFSLASKLMWKNLRCRVDLAELRKDSFLDVALATFFSDYALCFGENCLTLQTYREMFVNKLGHGLEKGCEG